MEQKTEREWKSITCPIRKDKTLIMVEWDLVAEKGRILKRTLRQIDCHHPLLMVWGGCRCEWGCKEVIGKRERS